MPTIYQLLESGLHFSYHCPWSPHPPGSSPLFSEVRTRKFGEIRSCSGPVTRLIHNPSILDHSRLSTNLI